MSVIEFVIGFFRVFYNMSILNKKKLTFKINLKISENKSNLFSIFLVLIIAGKLFAILTMKTTVCYRLLLLYLFLPVIGSAQLLLVTGTIINEKTGESLENVNIFESLTGIGTITNISGYFSLMLKPGKAEFVITHEGYKDCMHKMDLQRDTTLIISLVQLSGNKAKSKETEPQKTAHKINTEEKLK